jgi:hypothetical protein
MKPRKLANVDFEWQYKRVEASRTAFATWVPGLREEVAQNLAIPSWKRRKVSKTMQISSLPGSRIVFKKYLG